MWSMLQSMLNRLTTFNAYLTAINAELEPHLPIDSMDSDLQHCMEKDEQILDKMSILRTTIDPNKTCCLANSFRKQRNVT